MLWRAATARLLRIKHVCKCAARPGRGPEPRAGEDQQRDQRQLHCTGCLLALRPMAMLGLEIPQEPKLGLTNELGAEKGQAHWVLLSKKRSRCSWLCFVLCCANQALPEHRECMERRNARGISSLRFAQAPTPVSEQGKQQIWGVLSMLPREILSLVGGSESQQQN